MKKIAGLFAILVVSFTSTPVLAESNYAMIGLGQSSTGQTPGVSNGIAASTGIGIKKGLNYAVEMGLLSTSSKAFPGNRAEW